VHYVAHQAKNKIFDGFCTFAAISLISRFPPDLSNLGCKLKLWLTFVVNGDFYIRINDLESGP
jgi:hypothetical protein